MSNPARNLRNRAQSIWPGAIVVERGRTHIKHQHPSDPTRFMEDTSLGPIHINGTQTEIDTAWVSTSGVWDWEMTLADYTARIKAAFNGSPLVEFGVGSDTITLQPGQINWTNNRNDIQLAANVQSVNVSISDDVARWTNAYGTGIHFEWQTQTGRLAKKILLDNYSSLPAPSSQILGGTNPVLQPRFQMDYGTLTAYVNGQAWTGGNRPDVDTSSPIEFRRANNSVAFVFDKPHVYDANGEEATGVTHRVNKTGPNLLIEINIPQTWLETAVYPVTIDPTINPQPTGGTDDADESTSGDTDTTQTAIRVRAGQSRNWGGCRFTVTGPANGDTIDVSYLTVVATALTRDDPNFRIYMEKVADPAAFSDGTGNSDISGRTLTTAYVSWAESSIGTSAYNSPSIVTPVQEVIDNGFTSGNHMATIWYDSTSASNFYATSYDGSSSTCPILHIEYTAGGGATLTVADASVTPQVDTFALTQVHNITVSDSSVTPQVDTFNLTQIHNLLVNDAFVTTQVDAIVVTTGAATLVVANASVTPQVDTFNLTQIHNLLVNNTSVTPQVDTPVIFQAHVLSVNGTSVTLQVDAITSMTQVHNLNVGDTFVVTQADVLSLTQVHNLSVNDSYVVPTVDATVISVISQAAVIYWHLFHRDKDWTLEDRDLGWDLFDRDSNWDLEDI